MFKVYYRPPDQGEPVNKAFLLQLQETLHLKAFIIIWDFSHMNTWWERNTVSCKQSRKLQESTENNSLV